MKKSLLLLTIIMLINNLYAAQNKRLKIFRFYVKEIQPVLHIQANSFHELIIKKLGIKRKKDLEKYLENKGFLLKELIKLKAKKDKNLYKFLSLVNKFSNDEKQWKLFKEFLRTFFRKLNLE